MFVKPIRHPTNCFSVSMLIYVIFYNLNTSTTTLLKVKSMIYEEQTLLQMWMGWKPSLLIDISFTATCSSVVASDSSMSHPVGRDVYIFFVFLPSKGHDH